VLQASTRTARTERTVTNLDALMAILEETRKQGYALIDQEVEQGLRSIAVPLTTVRGQTLAALNVGLGAGAESMSALAARYLPALRKVQAELSQVLT